MIFARKPFQVRGWRFAASFETFWRLRASVRDRILLLGLEPFSVRYILRPMSIALFQHPSYHPWNEQHDLDAYTCDSESV